MMLAMNLTAPGNPTPWLGDGASPRLSNFLPLAVPLNNSLGTDLPWNKDKKNCLSLSILGLSCGQTLRIGDLLIDKLPK